MGHARKVFENGKVLVVVFDGLRPDRITPEVMPNLSAFLAEGAVFPNTGSAFPSETRVQVSTVMSGNPPGAGRGGHGIMANAFYDPRLGFEGPMDTSDDARMRRADRIYGRLFGAHHMAEHLFGADRRFAAVTTGKVGNARLLAGRAAELGHPVLSIHGDLISTPQAGYRQVVERFGPCPEATLPNLAVMDWATRILLEHTMPDHRPDFAVLWLNEPDLSYHYRGIASADAVAAQRGADRNFGRVLDWWQSEGRALGFRIIAVSDHGQVTVEAQVDVMSELRAAGFSVGPAIGPDADLALKTGYSAQISARDREPRLIDRLLRTLTETSWCGPVFARDRHMRAGADRLGALPMSRINYNHPRSPDIAFTLRGRSCDWSADGSEPVAGTCLADNADIPVGGGLHGGLMTGELTHLLALGGDDIRAGRYPTPTGTVDIAPTALALMGLPADPLMAGRALVEALPEGAAPEIRTEILETSGPGGYRQRLTLASATDAGGTATQDRLNGCWYLREGLRTDDEAG